MESHKYFTVFMASFVMVVLSYVNFYSKKQTNVLKNKILCYNNAVRSCMKWKEYMLVLI